MRRRLAVAFALAALLATAALVGSGLRCGVKSVREPCFGAEACDAKAECLPRVHPFAPLYAAFSVAGLAGAFLRRPLVPLGAGVVGAGLGALVGLSLGLWGIGISLLLVASGWAATPREKPARLVAWAAFPAALLPVPLLLLLVATAPSGLALPLVWAVTLGPAAGWGVFAAAMRAR